MKVSKWAIENNIAKLEMRLACLKVSAGPNKNRYNIPTNGILLGELDREINVSRRFSYAKVNGHQYLRIQDFKFDNIHNFWYPIKGKCSTIRLHELIAVKAFIQKAIDISIRDHESSDEYILTEAINNGDHKAEIENDAATCIK